MPMDSLSRREISRVLRSDRVGAELLGVRMPTVSAVFIRLRPTRVPVFDIATSRHIVGWVTVSRLAFIAYYIEPGYRGGQATLDASITAAVTNHRARGSVRPVRARVAAGNVVSQRVLARNGWHRQPGTSFGSVWFTCA